MIALAWLRVIRWALAGWYPADAVADLDGEIARRESERRRRR